jgi:hypothetical protein
MLLSIEMVKIRCRNLIFNYDLILYNFYHLKFDVKNYDLIMI